MAVDDAYTVCLLHFDGEDASTTFTDESGKSWTALNQAQIDTAQYKFGGSSLLLDGVNDAIYTNDHADFAVGSGNFTIDTWIRLANIGKDQIICAHGQEGNVSNFSWIFYVASSNKLSCTFGIGGSGVNLVSSSQTVSQNVWTHVAVTRNGSNWYLFQDGTNIGSINNSGTINNTNQELWIGVDDNSARDFDGWIDEFRVSKGIARWTSDFTPPDRAYGIFGNPTIWF